MRAIDDQLLIDLTAKIVVSYVQKNPVQIDSLPELLRDVHEALADISLTRDKPAVKVEPAVLPAKSVTDEYLICLEDGRKLKMLKRYLRAQYDMSPDDYRERWNLPPDYPMVAPAYARSRSDFAKKIGLGRKKQAV